jgi:hypothetical protein
MLAWNWILGCQGIANQLHHSKLIRMQLHGYAVFVSCMRQIAGGIFKKALGTSGVLGRGMTGIIDDM